MVNMRHVPSPDECMKEIVKVLDLFPDPNKDPKVAKSVGELLANRTTEPVPMEALAVLSGGALELGQMDIIKQVLTLGPNQQKLVKIIGLGFYVLLAEVGRLRDVEKRLMTKLQIRESVSVE
jgi:hypothetical protein